MSLWDGAQWDFDKAAGDYFESLAEAGVPEEDSRRAAQAYARYAEALQEAWSAAEPRERALAAYLEYSEVMARAWAPEARAARASDTYRRYVHALREAWTTADVDTIDPAALAAIANGMLSVAWTAGLSAPRPVRQPVEGG